MADDTTKNSDNYSTCVEHCNSLFANNPAALVACINGCATVNAPKGLTVSAEITDFRDQVEKLGRGEFFRKLKAAARKATSQLPDDADVAKLDAASKQYVEQVTALRQKCVQTQNWDDAAIAILAANVSWAKLATDIAAMAMDNGGGGSGPTCVTRCANEYNQCTSENQCDTSGWICFCCAPCSLQYMGCVAKCVTSAGGLRRITIA